MVGRALHYYHTAVNEPLGVVLAMQSTQEGQQPALNTQVRIGRPLHKSRHYNNAM